MLSLEQRFLIECLSDYIAGTDTAVPEGLNWEAFLELAASQKVTAFVYHQCDTLPEKAGLEEILKRVEEWFDSDSEIPWDEHLALLLMQAADRLLSSGIVFRQFVDITVVASRTKIDWQSFYRLVDEYHIERFTAVCFALINRWFGVDIVALAESDLTEAAKASLNEAAGDAAPGGTEPGNASPESMRRIEISDEFYEKATQHLLQQEHNRPTKIGAVRDFMNNNKVIKNLGPAYGFYKDFKECTVIIGGMSMLPFVLGSRALWLVTSRSVMKKVKKIAKNMSDARLESFKNDLYSKWGLG